MTGPQKKKMPDKLICTGCDFLISKELGGTERFPKKWTAYHCKHPRLSTEISFIKRNTPWTPKWCPILDKIEFDRTATKTTARNYDRWRLRAE